MGEHIQKYHTKFRAKISLNLPSFWKFLRINAKDKKCPEFYDFLRMNKHPWLNTPVFKCIWNSSSYKCQKIFSSKAKHDDHQGVWYPGYQLILIKIHDGPLYMISKDEVRPLTECEFLVNPNNTISYNERKELLENIDRLLENDPENEEIPASLKDKNIMEDVKWKIYSKARRLKFNKYYDEALKMIKLLEPFLTQYLKWFELHLKLLAIKKDWDQIENQKYNYLLIEEYQIYRD
jgi:hypothetical protein